MSTEFNIVYNTNETDTQPLRSFSTQSPRSTQANVCKLQRRYCRLLWTIKELHTDIISFRAVSIGRLIRSYSRPANSPQLNLLESLTQVYTRWTPFLSAIVRGPRGSCVQSYLFLNLVFLCPIVTLFTLWSLLIVLECLGSWHCSSTAVSSLLPGDYSPSNS